MALPFETQPMEERLQDRAKRARDSCSCGFNILTVAADLIF
jgi:hypothetical protein